MAASALISWHPYSGENEQPRKKFEYLENAMLRLSKRATWRGHMEASPSNFSISAVAPDL